MTIATSRVFIRAVIVNSCTDFLSLILEMESDVAKTYGTLQLLVLHVPTGSPVSQLLAYTAAQPTQTFSIGQRIRKETWL